LFFFFLFCFTLYSGNINLGRVQSLVLDEADEMLRMGFVDACEKIMETMPEDKQTLLFSATLPKWVKNLSRKYQNDAVTVDTVGDDSQRTATTVTHLSMCVPDDPTMKAEIVAELCRRYSPVNRVMVFCATKMDVDRMCSALPSSVGIHGDVAQARRERVLAGFRSGEFRVLVATDVAARGIDVPEIGLVVNAFFPQQVEPYIHRSGRTGRAGKTGTAVLLHSADERHLLQGLCNQIGTPISPVYAYTAEGRCRSVSKSTSGSALLSALTSGLLCHFSCCVVHSCLALVVLDHSHSTPLLRSRVNTALNSHAQLHCDRSFFLVPVK
jgi:superfamily II DNA/RNA helicase